MAYNMETIWPILLCDMTSRHFTLSYANRSRLRRCSFSMTLSDLLVIHVVRPFQVQYFFAQLCSSWEDFNPHRASRGPPYRCAAFDQCRRRTNRHDLFAIVKVSLVVSCDATIRRVQNCVRLSLDCQNGKISHQTVILVDRNRPVMMWRRRDLLVPPQAGDPVASGWRVSARPYPPCRRQRCAGKLTYTRRRIDRRSNSMKLPCSVCWSCSSDLRLNAITTTSWLHALHWA